MTLTLTQRNLDLGDARQVLEDQHRAKYDIVTHSDLIRYTFGQLEVVTTDGAYYLNPTDQFEGGVSQRLDIPRKYLRRLRDDAKDHVDYSALDKNVNHWLSRSERNWFIRGFRWDDESIARAFLSDRYNCIDHMDALFATLDGIAGAGIRDVEVEAVDLSERSLRVKITSPSIRAAVPNFVENYRSPFGDNPRGSDQPFIYAGLVMSNSETGSGAFQIAPHVTVLVCKNGMTRTAQALRKVHLGEKMEAGQIEWSRETRNAGIDLIKNQARDAVTYFLSQSYLDEVADELETAADVTFERPQKAVELVSKQMKYTDDEQDRIMSFFMTSGDPSAGGLVNAVTAFAQTVANPDRAAELEESAFDALAVAMRVDA